MHWEPSIRSDFPLKLINILSSIHSNSTQKKNLSLAPSKPICLKAQLAKCKLTTDQFSIFHPYEMERSTERLAVYEQAKGNESTAEQALTQTAGKCISKPGLSCLLVQIPGDEGRLMRYAQKNGLPAMRELCVKCTSRHFNKGRGPLLRLVL